MVSGGIVIEPKGPFLLEYVTKGCLDGECKGEVIRRKGQYVEVRCWRIIYTERKHFFFETKEKAYEWATARSLELREA